MPTSLLDNLLPQAHPRFAQTFYAPAMAPLTSTDDRRTSTCPTDPSAHNLPVYSPLGLPNARRGLPQISVEVRQCSEGVRSMGHRPSHTGIQIVSPQFSLPTCQVPLLSHSNIVPNNIPGTPLGTRPPKSHRTRCRLRFCHSARHARAFLVFSTMPCDEVNRKIKNKFEVSLTPVPSWPYDRKILLARILSLG
jgi:hypothetical protein